MKATMTVLTVLLAIIVIGSAMGKFRKAPQVMATMTHVGLNPQQIIILAIVEVLGGLGLLIGFASKTLGVLSAIGLSFYFVGAVIAHIRKRDKIKELAAPLVILVIALVTTWLQFNR